MVNYSKIKLYTDKIRPIARLVERGVHVLICGPVEIHMYILMQFRLSAQVHACITY